MPVAGEVHVLIPSLAATGMSLPPTPRNGAMNFLKLSLWEKACALGVSKTNDLDSIAPAPVARPSFSSCRLVIRVFIALWLPLSVDWAYIPRLQLQQIRHSGHARVPCLPFSLFCSFLVDLQSS